MIDDYRELILFGARLANPEAMRSLIPDSLFSGELAAILKAPNGQQVPMLWKWMETLRVTRVGSEKPLEAITRTLKENKERRSHVQALMVEINSLTAEEVGSVTRLRQLRDKVRGRSDPVPDESVSKVDPQPNKPTA